MANGDAPPPAKVDPEAACLKCKAPRTRKSGQIYEGGGDNGMFARFFLCDDCAKTFSATPRMPTRV